MEALLWSSMAALMLSTILLVSQKILTLEECIAAAIEGMKDILEAIFILILAWGFGNVVTDLDTVPPTRATVVI